MKKNNICIDQKPERKKTDKQEGTDRTKEKKRRKEAKTMKEKASKEGRACVRQFLSNHGPHSQAIVLMWHACITLCLPTRRELVTVKENRKTKHGGVKSIKKKKLLSFSCFTSTFFFFFFFKNSLPLSSSSFQIEEDKSHSYR